ncbi:hypothetical protein ACH4U5_28445 [Streptomyces sp. NPDC020858]|uniref:hypothetical protein n=1 Tax=Streptomyces sp. NPDC020858 TaxID=3365097 RepID=UPI0037BB043A
MHVRRSRQAVGLPLVLAAVTVTLAAVVGCAAGSGASAGAGGPGAGAPASSALVSGGPSASASASGSAAAAVVTGRWLTAGQVVAAAVPDAEVPGSYTNPVGIRKFRKPDPRFKPPSDLACGRVLDAAHAEMNVNTAPAVAEQTFNWKDDAYGSSSFLVSYKGSAAQIVFTLLRDGLTTCRYYEQEGPSGIQKNTVTTAPAPPLGDEAVQFEISTPTETGRHATQYTVVRTGHCVATFTKSSDGRVGQAFPPAVIARQITLLEEAQR